LGVASPTPGALRGTRCCQRMPDLRPSPPAAADGEPLAPLEFGIRHTQSAAIEAGARLKAAPATIDHVRCLHPDSDVRRPPDCLGRVALSRSRISVCFEDYLPVRPTSST
jgi:hypothetical protein